MSSSRHFGFALLPVIFCMACGESPGARGLEALELVARMHREIYASHVRGAKAFNQRPEAQEARRLAFWARCPLADGDGLMISNDLLVSFTRLRTRSRDEELLANSRQYLNQRALAARNAVAGYTRANQADPLPIDVSTRNAIIPIYLEEAAIIQKYLGKIDALATAGR